MGPNHDINDNEKVLFSSYELFFAYINAYIFYFNLFDFNYNYFLNVYIIISYLMENYYDEIYFYFYSLRNLYIYIYFLRRYT